MREDIKRALDRNKKANKLFSTFGFKKSYKELENHLGESEEVFYLMNTNMKLCDPNTPPKKTFKIKGKTPALFVITNKKVMAYYRDLLKEEIEQIPISQIQGTEINRGKISSTVVRVQSLTKAIDFDLTGCNSEEINLLQEALNKIV